VNKKRTAEQKNIITYIWRKLYRKSFGIVDCFGENLNDEIAGWHLAVTASGDNNPYDPTYSN